MGRDTSLFVGPVSAHLLCPLCLDVLQDPVETPCQHLFCEKELLDFYAKTGRTCCPVDNLPIDAKEIRRPGRVILSLLGELERYCDYKSEGCTWTGQQNSLESHLKGCCFNRELLREKEERIAALEELLQEKEKIIDAVHDKLAVCKQENRYLRERLRAVQELLDPLYLNGLCLGREAGRLAAGETGEGRTSEARSRSRSSNEEEEEEEEEDDDEEEEEEGSGSEDSSEPDGERGVRDEGRARGPVTWHRPVVEGDKTVDGRCCGKEEQAAAGEGRGCCGRRAEAKQGGRAPTDLQQIARLRALEGCFKRLECKGGDEGQQREGAVTL